MAKITNDLLKQAIADAEAVRETAVANAKLVLEESITPQIRDMIARRLRVEAENAEVAEDVELEEEVVEETTEEVSEEITEAEHESATEAPHEDGEAIGGADFPADSSDVGAGDNKEPSDDAYDASGIGDGGENVDDSHTDWYDDWSESDFDLDEVIRELEEDINALSEEEHEDKDEEESDEEHNEVVHEEEGEGDEEHLSQKDPHAHAKAGLKMDGADADHQEAPKGDDDEELDLEAILRELEADDDEGEEAHDDMGGHDKGVDHKAMAAELARLKDEMAQYREAVGVLRSRLNEVNLLNAKLLYTNKMFRKESLTNEQKIRIVESFDRATTTREVKLVYAALVENLATAAKTFNASRKKVVAEGLASKATPTTAPKSKEVIVENTVAKRLQQLAGII